MHIYTRNTATINYEVLGFFAKLLEHVVLLFASQKQLSK